MATVAPSPSPLPSGERVAARGSVLSGAAPRPRVGLEAALRRVLGPDYRMGILFVASLVMLGIAAALE